MIRSNGVPHWLRSALSLPPQRWWGIARTTVLAAYVEVGLRLMSLDRLAGSLGVDLTGSARIRRRETGPAEVIRPIQLTSREKDAIDTIRRVQSHRPFNGTCLRQSLLVGYALRSRKPVLSVGVTKHVGVVKAHAWIEIGGETIDDYRVSPTAWNGFWVPEPINAAVEGTVRRRREF